METYVGLETGDTTKDTLRIRGQDIPVETGMLEQEKLRFFGENPRIYSLVRPDESEPPQEEIERRLLKMEHVRELIRDIRGNGGLTDPLIVRSSTWEVLEGNSRLAAYRSLAREDAIKWGRVKCTVLPSDTDEALIFALLGQYHLKGKKDWVPFEQAGFLYRRYRVQGVDLDTLDNEINLGKSKIHQYIEAYELMLESGEKQIDRWSYYYEYIKSRKIRKVRDDYSTFDDVIIDKIRSGEISRAEDIRDKLPAICATSTNVLRKFAAGKIDFEQAYEATLEAGGEDVYFSRLKKFRAWIVTDDAGQALCGAKGQLRDRVKFEVRKIHGRMEQFRKRLGISE